MDLLHDYCWVDQLELVHDHCLMLCHAILLCINHSCRKGSLYHEQDTLAVAARMMPQDAYVRLAQGVFSFLNDWMMSLLADDAVPAYNMYGLFRLADDLASIQALADATQPPALSVHNLYPPPISHNLAFFLSTVSCPGEQQAPTDRVVFSPMHECWLQQINTQVLQEHTLL